ncbi:MAG TPA: hypothetical protein VLH38_02510 [Patescibacteria group bacterium]|nr:hypothetical protein [Patescibacteria group bacterium]
MNSDIANYYLSLLQVQMAVLGVVIAGIVALIQMLNESKPRRQANLLIPQSVLVGYVGFLTILLFVIAFGSWVATAPDSAARIFGNATITFFERGSSLFAMLLLSILGLLLFAILVYRLRRLLDPREYLKAYVTSVPPSRIRTYLHAVFQQPEETADGMIPSSSKAKRRSTKDVKSIRKYFEREQDLYDPFQPIREYLKDNTLKSYDYGTAAGLRLFSELFDKTLDAIIHKPKPNEYYYLARHLSESTLEFFTLFERTSSEKRKMDTIRLVYAKGWQLLEAGDGEGLLTIVRCLEDIAGITDDDDEIIAVINYTHALTDAYLARHEHATWLEIANTFEETCLSVTRLSENYYIQKDNPLKTVPIIGHYTGEHQSVTAALTDFFHSYEDLADRYPDAYPQYYFEAIEAVIEALFVRLGDIVANGQQNVGLNATYHQLVYSLYSLYSVFGLDAIEHKKPELLALCMGNLRRIIKPAKNMGLAPERATLTQMFVELALTGVRDLGDVKLKGERTISMYAKETLDKHALMTDITAAFTAVSEKGIDLKGSSIKEAVAVIRASGIASRKSH